jgi:hypothetical protein
MHAPTKRHMKWINRVWAYLANTPELGLTYSRSIDDDDANALFGYADADYGGGELDPADKVKHKSTSGWCFMMNGAAISYASKLQKIVSCSSAESEYYALGSACMFGMGIRNLLAELQILRGPTTVFEDNHACIAIATQEQCSSKLKHIAIKYHLVRCYIRDEEYSIEYVSTMDQIADGLTKGLLPELHKFFAQRIMGVIS